MQKKEKKNEDNNCFMWILFALILILAPIVINFFIPHGLFSLKFIPSVFDNNQWFEFYATYIPTMIAFGGTLYAIQKSTQLSNNLMKFEKTKFAFELIPTIEFTFNNKSREKVEKSKISKEEINLLKDNINNQIESLKETAKPQNVKWLIYHIDNKYAYNQYDIINDNKKEKLIDIKAQIKEYHIKKTKYETYSELTKMNNLKTTINCSNNECTIEKCNKSNNTNVFTRSKYSIKLKNMDNLTISKIIIKEITFRKEKKQFSVTSNKILNYSIQSKLNYTSGVDSIILLTIWDNVLDYKDVNSKLYCTLIIDIKNSYNIWYTCKSEFIVPNTMLTNHFDIIPRQE